MGKEKIIGALLIIIAALAAIYYTWGLVLLQGPWWNAPFQQWVQGIQDPLLRSILGPDPMFLIILPILLAVLLICVIGIWIGYTMLTTPAPEPLEDFDFDEEAVEEDKKEEEEKKE